MIFYKICSVLTICILASVILIYADTNGQTNNLNPINGPMMNGNLMNGNNNNFVEEDNVAECTRCSESRLVGCLRGKCYYRCYRRCTLGNLTYVEALRFTLPGY